MQQCLGGLSATYVWKSFFRTGGGGGGGGSKFETEHKIWRIVWLVGVYCESDGPQ